MSAIFTVRFQWLTVGLAALAAVGLGLVAARVVAPVAQPAAEAPPCTSCDTRHARLTDLSAAQPKDTE